MFLKNSNRNFNVENFQSPQLHQDIQKFKYLHQPKSQSYSEPFFQQKQTKMQKLMEINIKKPLYHQDNQSLSEKQKTMKKTNQNQQNSQMKNQTQNLNRSFHLESEQIKQNLSSLYLEIQTRQTVAIQDQQKNELENQNNAFRDFKTKQKNNIFQVQNTNSQAQKQNRNVEFFQLPSGKLKTNKSIGQAQKKDVLTIQKNKISPNYMELQNKITKQSFRQFTYTAESFILIQKLFAEYSLQNKMEITQNTNQFITVKKNQKNSFLNFANCCIMKICFKGNENQTQIYQLKNMTVKKGSGQKSSQQYFNSFKAKIILISGEEPKFNAFCQKFLYTLFLKDFLLLNHPQEAINLILFQKKSQIQNLKRKSIQFCNYLSYSKITQSYQEMLIKLCLQAKSLQRQIKNEFQRKSSKKIQIQDSVYSLDLASQSQLLKQFYKEIGLMKIFQIHSKRQKNQLSKKIDTIIRKNSIQNIFEHLQMQQHYQLFLNHQKKISHSSTKKIQQLPINLRYPYYECIQILQKINNSKLEAPQEWLKLFLEYFQTLKHVHQDLYKNKMKFTDIELDVDDQISITVFCLLFCNFPGSNNKNSQSQTKLNYNENNLVSIIRFLQIYVNHCEDNSQISNLQKTKEYRQKANRPQEQLQKVKKIIVNFSAALEYILNQWPINS